MSGNIKFMFLLAPIVIALLVVVTSPVISSAGELEDLELEDAQKKVRLNPNDAGAHAYLGRLYIDSGRNSEGINSYKEAIRIKID